MTDMVRMVYHKVVVVVVVVVGTTATMDTFLDTASTLERQMISLGMWELCCDV